MPVGKVRYFNRERGFGFIVGEDGNEVFLPPSALPSGVDALYPGTRVEYGVAQGSKGAQALSLRILETPSRVPRRSPDAMAVIVEDLVKVLDSAGEDFKRGRWPKAEQCRLVAAMLRRVAENLEAQ